MEIKILIPDGCNPNDIKRTITTKNGITTMISSYPNGFILTIKQDNDGNFTIVPSKELVNLGNGVYQIPN